jgi:hypothetical protein
MLVQGAAARSSWCELLVLTTTGRIVLRSDEQRDRDASHQWNTCELQSACLGSVLWLWLVRMAELRTAERRAASGNEDRNQDIPNKVPVNNH